MIEIKNIKLSITESSRIFYQASDLKMLLRIRKLRRFIINLITYLKVFQLIAHSER